jgi:hypothetical protein
VRILITEEALQNGNGHWPSYIGGIAEGLRIAGDDVDVLVHRNATDAVIDQVGGTRWFSRNCWHDKASQGGLGGVRDFHDRLQKAFAINGVLKYLLQT